jgi:hypothetical protein
MENDMSDIANAIYRHLRTMAPHQLERLTAIQLKEAANEIERLRLTATERGSLDRAAAWLAKAAESRKELHSAGYLCEDAAVLRSILERFN